MFRAPTRCAIAMARSTDSTHSSSSTNRAPRGRDSAISITLHDLHDQCEHSGPDQGSPLRENTGKIHGRQSRRVPSPHTARLEATMTDLTRRNALVASAASGAIAALRLPPAHAANAPQPPLPIPAELKANAQGEISFSARAGTAN